MEEIYEGLPHEPLDVPGFEDLQGPIDSEASDDQSGDDSDDMISPSRRKNQLGDEIVAEFHRERLRDDELRQQKLEEIQKREHEKS